MIIKEPFGFVFVFLKPGCESTAVAPGKRVKGELHTVPLLLLAWLAGQEPVGCYLKPDHCCGRPLAASSVLPELETRASPSFHTAMP